MSDLNAIREERLPVDPDLLVAVMAPERTWAVPANRADPFASPPRPITPSRNTGATEETMNTEQIDNISKGTQGYWSRMTPEQRSAEIRRRRQVSAAKRAGAPAPAPDRESSHRARGRRPQAHAPQSAGDQVSRVSLHALSLEYQRRLAVLREVSEWISEATES